MAGIAEKLTDLQIDLEECRRAITYRGGEISATAGFKEVAEKIASLPASSSIGTVVDENTSALKVVPSNSTKYCCLKALGGMTYRDEENNTLIDNKPTALKVHGSNAINLDAVLKAMGVGYTKNGDSYTLGSNLISGFRNPRKFTDYPQVCTISIESSSYTGYTSPRLYLGYMDDNGTFTARGTLTFGSNTTTVTSTGVVNAIRTDFSGTSGTPLSVTFSKLRINYGTVDCGYQPYHAPTTIPIPESLQGTGKGVEGASDTIDFEKDKATTKTKTINLGDVAGYTVQSPFLTSEGVASIITYSVADFNPSLRAKALCSHLPTHTDWTGNTYGVVLQNMSSGNHYMKVCIMAADAGIEPGTSSGIVLQKVKQWLKDNNVTLTYAIAEPTETDIDTSAFDNLIEVQAGGSIEIITDNGKAVPTTIMYQTLL